MIYRVKTLFFSIPLVTLYTIMLASVSAVASGLFNKQDASWRISKLWSKLLLLTCGVKVMVEGVENLELNGPCIIMSNHQSQFDIPILYSIIQKSFRTYYKSPLEKVPFLGWHLKFSDNIAIARGDRKQAIKTIRTGNKHLKHGKSLLLFPEGTRSENGVLGKFKRGGFILAEKNNLPIIPITIIDSYEVMKKGDYAVMPKLIKVIIDRPLYPAGEDMMQQLKELMKLRMEQN